jgi:hypothetical protein
MTIEQIKELKINNWLLYKNEPKIVVPETYPFWYDYAKDTEPITLTPEILLNNGWEEKDYTLSPEIIRHFTSNNIHITYASRDLETMGVKEGEFIITNKLIKYVNHLQNYLYEVYNYEWNPNL